MTHSFSVRALFAIALFAVSACGGDDAPADDASVDASSSVDATSPIDATTDDAMAPIDATATVDAACVPRAADSSAIGDRCDSVEDCPTGYTCQPFSGVVLTHSCQIRCERDCDCPDERACVEASDKGDTWTQCGGPGAAR